MREKLILMADKETYFKCLRCGYEYRDPSLAEEPIKERTCPKCRSNSVRKISK